MAEAIVGDKFTFANGDTGVVLAMQSGDFAGSDFVLEALVKHVTCELGDKIESR